MANAFERFKQRNQLINNSEKNVNADFIALGYASVTMINDADDTITQLAYVYNKQENDEGYIYTPYIEPIQIGSCWSVKGLHFLVDEEIVIIKDVKFRKYHALLCNIEADGTWWYFKKDDYVDVSLRRDTFIKSLAKPLLVTAGKPFDYNDKVMIADRAWLIQEFDNYTHPGVTYYSVTATTMSKDEIETRVDNKPVIEKAEEIPFDGDENPYKIIPNQEYEVETENGYFRTSCKVLKVISRTSNLVKFSIPFVVDVVEIEVKQQGEILTITYTKDGE